MVASNAFGAHVPVYRSLSGVAEAQSWLRELPALVAALEREWEVETGAPYEGGSTAWTAPARCWDETRAVLKVGWPHDKARGEIDALELWDGNGAVGLYRSDRSRWALLIEQCVPGVPLSRADLDVDLALRAAADV